MKARDYGVNPERLGVLADAGGHLALLLATTGDDGDPKAKDEVLRQCSRVAAVVALYPPTDIRDWVSDPPEVIRRIAALKPPLTFDAKLARLLPAAQGQRPDAPTLLIHGDKDELVPIEHSEKMLAAMQKAGVDCKLVVVRRGPRFHPEAEPGAGHAGHARLVRQTPGGHERPLTDHSDF